MEFLRNIFDGGTTKQPGNRIPRQPGLLELTLEEAPTTAFVVAAVRLTIT
jgi:hypothetical protein